MRRLLILTAAFAVVWVLPVPADAHPDQPGGPTYGGIDNRTPACVTRSEWSKLHTGRHDDRPRWYYVKNNLLGRDAHYITWSMDGRDTAYGSAPCWNPRHRIAKVFVHWTGREWGYRVYAKRIVRP